MKKGGDLIAGSFYRLASTELRSNLSLYGTRFFITCKQQKGLPKPDGNSSTLLLVFHSRE